MQSNNGGGYKGNERDPEKDPDHNEDNIIRIPTLAERNKMKKAQERQWRQEHRKANKAEPIINLPPVTKYMIMAIIIPFIITSFIMDDIDRIKTILTFGFIPGYFTGHIEFTWNAVLGIFTYIFLHGNITHLMMNVVMLAAFGTGVERWMGGKRMLIYFILCSAGALILHTALNHSSSTPVIGASGGLSGLFAAVLIMLQQRGAGGVGKYGIWPFIAIWIVISILFGSVSTPGTGGHTVAWAAHIGGFLAGFILLKPVLNMKR
jgi:membrane associated rhomboid family serine protease